MITTDQFRTARLRRVNLADPATVRELAQLVLNDLATLTAQDVDLQAQITSGVSGTSASGIVADGVDQTDATILTKTRNRVDTVAAGTGVVANITATPGFTQTVQNKGAEDLLYYPFGTNNFLGQAASDPITIASGNQATVFCYDAGILTLI